MKKTPKSDSKDIEEIDRLKQILDVKIEEDFGLNSMHMVRIDGSFSKVCARSESAYRSHVETVVLLSKQKIDK